jgi:antitoxin (DNA-binding transcriptional repressor) of toxin-antitoxin stability system
MSTSAARKDDLPDTPGPSSPQQSAHLRLAASDGVTVKGFTELAERAAEESGQDLSTMLAFLAGAMVSQLPDSVAAVVFADVPDPTPEQVRELLRTGALLEENVRTFLDRLRAYQPTEVPASEVRTNWAGYLERVRAKEETTYVTLRGKRVAALTPPFVAEQYAQDQSGHRTPEWQAGEAEIEADKAAGRVTGYASADEFLAELGGEGE